jgi:hypothetical protein
MIVPPIFLERRAEKRRKEERLERGCAMPLAGRLLDKGPELSV